MYVKRKREAPLQSKLIRHAKRRGWLAHKLCSESANGWPDVFCLRRGVTLMFETKTPVGKRSENQRLRHKEIREHGGTVYTVNHDDWEFICALLE